MRRREALVGGVATGLVWLLAGCGTRPRRGRHPAENEDGGRQDSASPDSTSPPVDTGQADCSVTPGVAGDGWVEVPLADHPSLLEPGGSATLALPESLLYVVVACTAPECWTALWSTCTHGACGILWDADAGEAWCPCHGSRFSREGAVLQGPAVRPLSAFSVGRRGDSLWIHRPL